MDFWWAQFLFLRASFLLIALTRTNFCEAPDPSRKAQEFSSRGNSWLPRTRGKRGGRERRFWRLIRFACGFSSRSTRRVSEFKAPIHSVARFGMTGNKLRPYCYVRSTVHWLLMLTLTLRWITHETPVQDPVVFFVDSTV